MVEKTISIDKSKNYPQRINTIGNEKFPNFRKMCSEKTKT